MKNILVMLGLVAVLAACGGNGNSPSGMSNKVSKNVVLTGAQVVPSATTASTGAGLITVDMDSGAVSGNITVFGFTGTDAHLYTGAVGANGAVAVALAESSPGTWSVVSGSMLTSDQMNAFNTGGLYVGISSAANPSGEIRGQVGRLIYYASLGGSQEVPATTSTATGVGVYVLDPDTKTLSGSTTSTVTGVAAHIHTGVVGASGPVTLPFTGGPTTWTLAPVVLTDAQLASLQTGGFYANVHSTASPGGEIRGQVYQASKITNLAGTNETPPNTSSASGMGALGFNPFTRAVAGRIETTGITGVAAHAHLAANGVAGGVVIPMTQSSATSGIWTSAPGVVPNDSVFLGFVQGNLYLNVHSSAFPGGEIRGQLTQGR
jgi:hypothetical protein